MATSVTIIYNGPVVETIRPGMPIPRLFTPDNSYVDTPVFTEGFANTAQLGDKESYGKSIYATNVDGQGFLPGLLPMFSNTQKFAMFERAIFAAKEAEKAGTENAGVTFEVTGFEEELYWEQISNAMKDQGFEVTVTPANEEETDPGNEETDPENP